jgi:hypothetical protein
LFQKAGLKPMQGRVGPRAYDVRQHADFLIMPTVFD